MLRPWASRFETLRLGVLILVSMLIGPITSSVGHAQGADQSALSAFSEERTAVDTKKPRDFKFGYLIRSGYDSFANEREQSQFVALAIGGAADYNALPRLRLYTRAVARVVSQYAQSRFGDNVSSNGVLMEEAYGELHVVDMKSFDLDVKGGALDMGYLRARMLVNDRPFPGMRQTAKYKSDLVDVEVMAQQTIPTSTTLSAKTVDSEVTPSFLTETFEATIKPHPSFRVQGFVTHYQFNNLPSAVALDSVVYGNTIEETGPNTARFKYRFNGFMAGGRTYVGFNQRTGWGVEGYVLQNNEAPEGYRNGQFLETQFNIGLPGRVDLSPVAGIFFVEDDVVPGYYNSSRLGHNNRQGQTYALEAAFRQERFKLRAEYIDSDIISDNYNQSRQQFFMLRFETLYEYL